MLDWKRGYEGPESEKPRLKVQKMVHLQTLSIYNCLLAISQDSEPQLKRNSRFDEIKVDSLTFLKIKAALTGCWVLSDVLVKVWPGCVGFEGIWPTGVTCGFHADTNSPPLCTVKVTLLKKRQYVNKRVIIKYF